MITALLTKFGIELAVGGLGGTVLGLLSKPAVTWRVIKAARAGIKHLATPDRPPTTAEVDTMERMHWFD